MPKRLTPEQRRALGDLVRRKRGRTSIDAMASRAPMSPVTWARVEDGETVRSGTYAGVEVAFGWQPGAVDDYVTTGREPERELGEEQATSRALPSPPLFVHGGNIDRLIDWVADAEGPDAVKLAVIRAILRRPGDPLGAVLDSELGPEDKVTAIEMYRAAQAAAAEPGQRSA